MQTALIFTKNIASDPTLALLNVSKIYVEPEVYKYIRGREILSKYPDAEIEEVKSHWNIPGLFGNEGNVSNWNKIKSSVLVLGIKKGMTFIPNSRSSDFIAPSTANGCIMSCAYCYVPRNKGYANPLSVFVNIEQICRSIVRHAQKIGNKLDSNQADPKYWVYDIGCNSDCSVDAAISDNIFDLVKLFRDSIPNGLASFATKFVNRKLLSYDPQNKTRIRFSLMPNSKARVLDVRTSSIHERIHAINDFVSAGYEVHLNFSPVVVYEGWQEEYKELFMLINDCVSEQAKKQLACEIIFLTHNEQLHQINLGWHPKAETLLWTPENQELKRSERGGINIRYKSNFKGRLVNEFKDLLMKHLPYCRVRYAF